MPDSPKRALFGEVFALLTEGGVFFDLDCVRSASPELHTLSPMPQQRVSAAAGLLKGQKPTA